MLEGKLINLRPVQKDDLPLLLEWRNDPAAVSNYNFFGFRSPQSLLAGFEENGFLSQEQGQLLVVLKTGTAIGDVGYHSVHYGPPPYSRAYNIGISLIPAGRGQGFGVEAQRLLCHYLFAISPIARIEASTDVENLPEQRALEKAGFTREGIIRHAQFRNGTWHDLIQYSRLRHDPD